MLRLCLLSILLCVPLWTEVMAESDSHEIQKIHRSLEEWKKILSPEVYWITREQGTEKPFSGEYNDHYKDGTYLCSNCELPLFSSKHKYDSHTGWPSFWEPYKKNNILLKDDYLFFFKRTEVVCNRCGAHLGHLFADGPPPTNQRYCINSLALIFREQ